MNFIEFPHWRDLLSGNEPATLIVAASIGAGLLLIVAVLRFAARRIDEVPRDLAERTKPWLLFFPIVAIAVRGLVLPGDLAAGIRTLGFLALVVQVTIWTAGLVQLGWRRYGRRRVETDPSAITTVQAFRVASVMALWIVAFLVAIDNLGFDVTALLAGLGIGGIAVALATQRILGDLFASLSIVVDKPFVVGDAIRVGDDAGVVEQIGLKTTRIRSQDGEQIIFGNTDLLESRVRNYQRMTERRRVFRIGVACRTTADSLEQIPQVVRGIIEAREATRFDRAHFASFGPAEYVFEFVYYVTSPDYMTYMNVQQDINLSIVRAFEERGIQIADPARMLFVERR
jgi:small-conductance mechanosensitive channel